MRAVCNSRQQTGGGREAAAESIVTDLQPSWIIVIGAEVRLKKHQYAAPTGASRWVWAGNGPMSGEYFAW